MTRRRLQHARPVVRQRSTPPETRRADLGTAECTACGDTGWIFNVPQIRWTADNQPYRHKTWNSCHHCHRGA